MNVVPEGYHTVTPWMITAGRTAELIDFIVEVFDAEEIGRWSLGRQGFHRISPTG